MVKKPSSLQKVSHLEDRLKRALADYDNLEKRLSKEKLKTINFANAVLLEKIISVLDDLERVETFLKDPGLTISLDKLRSVLKSEGLEEVDCLGKEFSPELMDCLGLAPGPQNKVVSVDVKGYFLHGSLLRAARVQVGQTDPKKFKKDK